MIKKHGCGRRTFLKSAATGTAGLILASGNQVCTKPMANIPAAWTKDKKINPHIDNLRVVSCHDTSLVSGDPKSWNMVEQNQPVNRERVFLALDAMALSLAQKTDVAESWTTILRKPDGKDWKDVRVAIKVNCLSVNQPRVAVIAKICDVLNNFGCSSENIILFDGHSNAQKKYQSFIGKGLPTGLVVSKKDDSLGGVIKTDVPAPYAGSFKCTKAIADGSIDILINIAVNKGHNTKLGKTTLTMKNHAGIFEPGPIHMGGGLDYIIAMNKSNAILGGTPVRQQLCIVDSIWGMKKGPFGEPDTQLCRLIMGTFGPAVDYLTAKRIREPLLGVNHENLDRFLKDFDYTDFESLNLVSVVSPKDG